MGRLLAHEMGIGKTIVSITYMEPLRQHDAKAKFLVVSPLSVSTNWVAEIERFLTLRPRCWPGRQRSGLEWKSRRKLYL